jgi:hypothetical protein
MNLKDEYCNKFNKKLDPEKYCCICFRDLYFLQEPHEPQESQEPREDKILTLVDVEKFFFIDDFIPNNLLIKSCCNVHYICIECLRRCVNNYENHPINESESHIYCPYPFEDCLTSIGFKNIFEHHLIQKICTSESEWLDYSYHANKHAFPGFTIIKCPMVKCNTDILIKTEKIKNTSIGELIIRCSQNPKCSKRFCYYCKQYISYYSNICYDCKTSYENENPNVYNYYINKIIKDSPLETENTTRGTFDDRQQGTFDDRQRGTFDDRQQGIESSIESVKIILHYKESSYLYLNKEITENIVISQIKEILEDVNLYMICCICRRSLYKTEKCNGLSHHNLERCYSCGRIGFTVKGLIEHWNSNGVNGCFRFDTDSYVKKQIPEYRCSDTICFNHDKGDCKKPEHQNGIYKLEQLRVKSYIYHIIKSLLPEMSLKVYDILHEMYKNNETIYELLPYKQTFLLLHKYKFRYKDFSEEVLYSQLKCIYPGKIDDFYIDKSYTIDINEYTQKYALSETYEFDDLYYNLDDTITTNEMLPLLDNSIDGNYTDDFQLHESVINRRQEFTTEISQSIDITDITDIIDTRNTRNTNNRDIFTENVVNLLDNNTFPSDAANLLNLTYIPLTYRTENDTQQDDNDIVDEIINIYNTYTSDE